MVFELHPFAGHNDKIFITSVLVINFCIQCGAEISVYSEYDRSFLIDDHYRSYTSIFGPEIGWSGFTGLLTYNNSDGLACDSRNILPPPTSTPEWILLVRKGNCSYVDKVRNAQIKHYSMVIVFNNQNSEAWGPMRGKNASDIRIPSVFVSLTTGKKLINKYQYFQHVYIYVEDDNGLRHILMAALVILFFCAVWICCMVPYLFVMCHDYIDARRVKLPEAFLSKMPIKKFSSRISPAYEKCVICLDDFFEGEKLRILPCRHAYHAICIDTWLTENQRCCPICKHVVSEMDKMPIMGSESDLDSDSNDRTALLGAGPLQQGQTRWRFWLPYYEIIFTPSLCFARQHRPPNGDNVPSVAGCSYGTVILENHALPSSTTYSINPVDDDSISVGSIYSCRLSQ